MNSRLWLGAGLAGAFAPLAAHAQPDTSEGGRNWAAIAACAPIDSPEQRHRCMDDVLRRAGLLSDARVAQEARRDFGRDNRPAPPPPPPPAVASAPRRAPTPGSVPAPVPAAVPERPADINKLTTTIASVRTIGYRRLQVTTAEGSVWNQTEGETFNSQPKVGDTFEIERAALGSYRCRFAQLSRYRCERAD